MQTKRAAAAQKEAANARRSARRMAAPAGKDAAAPRRRRIGITGPGQRRVPSLIALKGAERHSRIVRTMRVLLPALALLVIGLVTLQALMYRADDTLKLSFANAGSIADDLKMVQPELSFPFGKENRFRATAKSAWPDASAPGRVNIKDVQADIAIGDSWLSLMAPKGVVDTKAAQVVLGGGIDFFSDLGYELHTQSAVFDTKGGTVTGQSEVSMQGPAGTGRSDGFTITDEGNRILLEGNVRMTFVPSGPPSG